MKNFKDCVSAGIGTLISAVGTSLQTNEILETVSLIITILGAILTITMSILTWWRNAKKDGKITKEEIDDGLKIVSDGVNEIKEITKKGEKDESKRDSKEDTKSN